MILELRRHRWVDEKGHVHITQWWVTREGARFTFEGTPRTEGPPYSTASGCYRVSAPPETQESGN